MFFEKVWAQAAPAAGSTVGPNMFESAFPYVLIALVFYWFIIRPAQQRAKTQQGFQVGLKRGDAVITNGGIFGTIEGLTEQFVVLEVAQGVRIRILKNQIAGNVKQETEKK